MLTLSSTTHYPITENRRLAEIREVATGRVTTRIPLPAGDSEWNGAAAIIDNRTFFLDAFRMAKRDVDGREEFYQVRIDGNGHISGMVRIAVPKMPGCADELAATPDGAKLAFVVNHRCKGPDIDEIDVLAVATGERRSWRPDGTDWSIRNLSWLADGRRLAFEGAADVDPDASYLRVLDTATRGDLSAVSTPIRLSVHDSGPLDTSIISPDGTKVYLATEPDASDSGPASTRITQFDAASGRRTRTLFQQRYAGRPRDNKVEYAQTCRAADGRSLLTVMENHTYRTDIATAFTTRLPYPDATPRWIAC